MSAGDRGLPEVRVALADTAAALAALDLACERAGSPTLHGWGALPAVADLAARVAAVVPTTAGRPVWRVEVSGPGCGVHLVADQADAVRLADAAPGPVWVEPVDHDDVDPEEGDVLDAQAVADVIAGGAW